MRGSNKDRSDNNKDTSMKLASLYTYIFILIGSSLIGTSSVAARETSASNLPLNDLQRFTAVIEHIRKYYVKPTEDKELFESAIRGMLQGLDPHSAYLDPSEFADLRVNPFSDIGHRCVRHQETNPATDQHCNYQFGGALFVIPHGHHTSEASFSFGRTISLYSVNDTIT